MGDVPGSDCNAIRDGWVSVSTIPLDVVSDGAALREWTLFEDAAAQEAPPL